MHFLKLYTNINAGARPENPEKLDFQLVAHSHQLKFFEGGDRESPP